MEHNVYIITGGTVLIGLLLCQLVLADDPNTKKESEGTRENPVVIEDIFQEIMLTIPADVKSDLESAKKVRNGTVTKEGTAEQIQNNGVADHIQNDQRFRELPEQVRQQVEKTIVEIDKTREERELQFKEMKKKKGNQ